MTAKVYKFKISYDKFENKIWREIEVSCNYPLSKLAYLVLVAFDTLANHMFFIECDGRHYEIDFDNDYIGIKTIDPTTVTLKQMNLKPGSAMTMIYNFGCEQKFKIVLESIIDMKKGTGSRYPRIVAGQGKGIIDNMFSSDFKNLIEKIDRTGKSTYKYLSPKGKKELWDYRDFDLDEVNRTLKSNIESIQYGFES